MLTIALIDDKGHCIAQNCPISFVYRGANVVVNACGVSWVDLPRFPAGYLIVADRSTVIHRAAIKCADERRPFTGRVFVEKGWIQIEVGQAGQAGQRYEWRPEGGVSRQLSAISNGGKPPAVS